MTSVSSKCNDKTQFPCLIIGIFIMYVVHFKLPWYTKMHFFLSVLFLTVAVAVNPGIQLLFTQRAIYYGMCVCLFSYQFIITKVSCEFSTYNKYIFSKLAKEIWKVKNKKKTINISKEKFISIDKGKCIN